MFAFIMARSIVVPGSADLAVGHHRIAYVLEAALSHAAASIELVARRLGLI